MSKTTLNASSSREPLGMSRNVGVIIGFKQCLARFFYPKYQAAVSYPGDRRNKVIEERIVLAILHKGSGNTMPNLSSHAVN